jgi:hypothetical protein
MLSEKRSRAKEHRTSWARLVNHERGQYKAYTLKDDAELPEDPDGKLQGIVPWRD